MTLLAVSDLRTHFFTNEGVVKAVDGVSFNLNMGETLGIVGASGCGKSVLALSLLRLIAAPGRILSGSARLTDSRQESTVDLLKLSEKELRHVRGKKIAMIFQEPMTSLNPVMTIGDQIGEVFLLHERERPSDLRDRSREMLEQVGIPDSARRLGDYPHQLSGGMRQRVMIAMALACRPDILIADEPTTALDVTVQAQILSLLERLRAQLDMALILITHDFGVVAELANRVAVMRAGQWIDEGTTVEIFHRHLPHGGEKSRGASEERSVEAKPILELEGIVKTFPGNVQAVRGVSLELHHGETLGLVGESGCGKSTLGLIALQLLRADAGQIRFEGQERIDRSRMQMVFQDPFASLNPRMTIGEILEEPFVIHRSLSPLKRRVRVRELLDLVGLASDAVGRYPHEFSGGQRQRVGIARAVALEPQLLIADEPVSSLDVSIREDILRLLIDLQKRFGLSMLFISHDMQVIQRVSHRIAVMYLGKIVEIFPADELHLARHPYTQLLMASVPLPDPTLKRHRKRSVGDPPSSIHPPSGCSFHPRCPYTQPRCTTEEPPLEIYRDDCKASCHYIREMNPVGILMNQGRDS